MMFLFSETDKKLEVKFKHPHSIEAIVEQPTTSTVTAATSTEVTGSLKLGNVWVFVQLIFGPPWPMNQLNKNPNIA